MDHFAAAMRAIRERQPGGQIGIARRAFPKASRKRHTSLAAYISKLETEQESNPSLDTLEWIARGCGFSLSELFAALERQTPSDLNSPPPIGDNARSPEPQRADDGDSVSRAADAYSLEILLGGIAKELGATIGEPIAAALDRLAVRNEQVSGTRRPPAAHRKDRRRRAG